MQSRILLRSAALLLAAGMAVSGCTTTMTPTVTKGGGTSTDSRHRDLNTNADAAIERLYRTVPDARELIAKANGVLIFPSTIAAGLGIGGQYGEGTLRVGGVTQDYYNLASVSVGLQVGAQSKTMVFLFMTQDALNKFRQSEGWAVGADASVALIKVGANGGIDINSARAPIVAFVMTNTGLMANLTLEGTKITRLKS